VAEWLPLAERATFPVDNSPAGGHNPRRQIAAFYVKQSPFTLHATPDPGVLLLARGRFPEAGGRRRPLPAAVPPVCIPFADAFQRLLTAHGKPGLCAVCLPAIRAFAQRHSTQHLLRYSYTSSQLAEVVFRGCQFGMLAAPPVVPSCSPHLRDPSGVEFWFAIRHLVTPQGSFLQQPRN
jgi:hypothetical protein